ncbi:MAG: RluA family pseudouridine synthase [Polyangiales bacterium]
MAEIETLYEDRAIVAVHKPAGWTVIPARDEPEERCLRARLEASRGEKLWVCHRIDRDTSGVVLFARTAEAHRSVNHGFESRSVSKRYAVFVRSSSALADSGAIRVALHSARKGKMRPALDGEPDALSAETHWELIAARSASVGFVSRLEARPKTGRQHQIRVHFRWMNAPLLVDSLYGAASSRADGELGEGSPALSRLTLHASSLTLAHPTSGAPLTIDAALPEDLAALDRWIVDGQSKRSE